MSGICVYIACPYTKGDIAVNTRNSMVAWDILYSNGLFPFNPLYSHFQHLHSPRPYEDWTKYDDEWVRKCDALIRLPGESSGGDKEVQLAKDYNIPVLYAKSVSEKDLIEVAEQIKSFFLRTF